MRRQKSNAVREAGRRQLECRTVCALVRVAGPAGCRSAEDGLEYTL